MQSKIAIAVVVVALLALWMFLYETVGPRNMLHLNRLTGATCPVTEECWFASSP